MSNVAPSSEDVAVSTHYAILPMDVASHAGLSDAAVRLYAVIEGRVTGKERQRVLQATMLEQLPAWSKRKLQRALAELVTAELVTTHRTGRSNGYRVVNPIREQAKARKAAATDAPNMASEIVRCATDGGSDAPNMAALQINKERSINNNTAPARQSSPAAALDADYLEAINAATGSTIKPTKAVRAHLAEIREQGHTPADTATLAAAYLAAAGDRVSSPSGYLAGHVLADLAAGNTPQPPTITASTKLPTVADVLDGDPCEHGEPRGNTYCALCRHQWISALDARAEQSETMQQIRGALTGWQLESLSCEDEDGQPWADVIASELAAPHWTLTPVSGAVGKAGVRIVTGGRDLEWITAIDLEADGIGTDLLMAVLRWAEGLRGSLVSLKESDASGQPDGAITIEVIDRFRDEQTAELIKRLPALMEIWRAHCELTYRSEVAA